MNQLLQEAFNRAADLPAEEQDRFARFLLAELDADQEWEQLFDLPESEELLSRLAGNALSEHREGLTAPLNPSCNARATWPTIATGQWQGHSNGPRSE